MIPVLCPGCRSPVPSDTVKCPWCGRNVNQGTWDEPEAGQGAPRDCRSIDKPVRAVQFCAQ